MAEQQMTPLRHEVENECCAAFRAYKTDKRE
jgi:hypothetical protein